VGYLAPPKTLKNIKYPKKMQLFPVFEGLSKTAKKRQKPLEYTGILIFEGYLAPPKTIKKRHKLLDYTIISRFWGDILNCQKRSKSLEYTVILVFWGVPSSSQNHQKT
jgi:hypothetical protein